MIGSRVGLQVGGLVNRPGRFGFDELHPLATCSRLSDLSTGRIDVIDLFTFVRLAADAEIAMVSPTPGTSAARWIGSSHSSSAYSGSSACSASSSCSSSSSRPVAFRIASMLNDPSMYFELAPAANGKGIDRHASVRLCGRDIIGESLTVSGLEFVTFAEFVGELS